MAATHLITGAAAVTGATIFVVGVPYACAYLVPSAMKVTVTKVAAGGIYASFANLGLAASLQHFAAVGVGLYGGIAGAIAGAGIATVAL